MTQEQWIQVFAIILPGTAMFASMTWFLATRIEGVRVVAIQVTSDLSARLSAAEARIAAVERLCERLVGDRLANNLER